MGSPTFTAIVQARMASTRLPGKALANLSGQSLLFHVLKRASKIQEVSATVLATSKNEENSPLILLADGMGLNTFAGSENNVLSRYCKAAEQFPADYIIRITGDNPFTDIDFADKTVELAKKTNADLCSFSNLPLGTAVEIVKTKALFKALEKATKPYQLEHVTPYIKENPDQFKVVHKNADFQNPFPNLRLTVDTAEDLELAQLLYTALYRAEPFGLDAVIDYIKTHPELIDINSHVEQRSMKSSAKSRAQKEAKDAKKTVRGK